MVISRHGCLTGKGRMKRKGDMREREREKNEIRLLIFRMHHQPQEKLCLHYHYLDSGWGYSTNLLTHESRRLLYDANVSISIPVPCFYTHYYYFLQIRRMQATPS
jgi:hypothetical protein